MLRYACSLKQILLINFIKTDVIIIIAKIDKIRLLHFNDFIIFIKLLLLAFFADSINLSNYFIMTSILPEAIAD